MLVSFLICGLEGRPWKSLADNIQRQIDNASVDCEVVTNVDSGEKSSGKKRNELTAESRGKYVAFIDDDDKVSDTYVNSICDALVKEETDLVTFCMRVTIRHRIDKFKRSRVSNEKWKLGIWNDDRRRGKMAANHLCVWRKDIAVKSAWCERLGYGDDQLWYGPLHALSAVKSHSFIDECLYLYDCNLMTSVNQTSARIAASKSYFGTGLRCFGDINSLLIEDGHQDSEFVLCRDSIGREVSVDTKITKPFHTVRLL